MKKKTPHGPILVTGKAQMEDGTEQDIYFADPFAFLHTCMHKYPDFNKLVIESIGSNGHVWTLRFIPMKLTLAEHLQPGCPNRCRQSIGA